MISPVAWNGILRLEAQTIAGEVEREARAYLITRSAGDRPMSTRDLAEAIYPEKLARGENITVRKKLLSALVSLSKKGLADCVTPGEVRRINGRMSVPNLWHPPRAPIVYNIGDKMFDEAGNHWLCIGAIEAPPTQGEQEDAKELRPKSQSREDIIEAPKPPRTVETGPIVLDLAPPHPPQNRLEVGDQVTMPDGTTGEIVSTNRSVEVYRVQQENGQIRAFSRAALH